MQANKSNPVMITGATGYVGGVVAKRFLEDGLTIHAPIRNPDKPGKTKYLDQIAAKTKGTIKYFKADLLDNGSYDEAAKGCELIIHTASPFISNPKDPQSELVDPALIGTTNILETANRINTVQRVVLTSSCAAIYGDAKDTLEYPNQTMTEDIWNTTSSLKQTPYSYSKVVAERKAWEINRAQDRWDLVVINPSLVLGPGISPEGTSESFNIVKQLGDGRGRFGVPDLNIGCVDVRDVAEAHFKAAFTPSAKGRHITSAENLNFLKLADFLRPEYGKKYPLPKGILPKWIFWIMAPMSGISRQFVKDNVGFPWKADNSKSQQELGMKYRPISKTINEFFQQLIDHGVFK